MNNLISCKNKKKFIKRYQVQPKSLSLITALLIRSSWQDTHIYSQDNPLFFVWGWEDMSKFLEAY